ncbi:MAG: EF-hand domain-containing protein [Crocosphaera sp.]
MKISLNKHQTEELRKFFQEVDQDNNGRIDRRELTELLETIWGQETEIDIKSAVQSTFDKCDLNHDGFITFDEFLSLAN